MLSELSALLDMLKAKGVASYSGPFDSSSGPINVAFAPEAPTLPDEENSKPLDMCKCGHPLAEHQGGMCMHACDEEKCA